MPVIPRDRLSSVLPIVVLTLIVIAAAVGRWLMDASALSEDEALVHFHKDIWLPLGAVLILLWWAVIAVVLRYHGRTVRSGVQLVWERMTQRHATKDETYT